MSIRKSLRPRTRWLPVFVLFSFVCAGVPPTQAQKPPEPAKAAVTLPDFSGYDVINSFTRLSGDRTDLRTLCKIRAAAIDEATAFTARGLERAQAGSGDPAEIVQMRTAMGLVCMYKGDVEQAIEHFDAGLRIANEHAETDPLLESMAYVDLAAVGVAWMRRGEVENCAMHHMPDMCIFPLSDAARHTMTSGSTRAIEYFKQYLEKDPNNLEVRWLLNVAYQTLGTYPEKVPAKYLIPPSAFESKEDIGRFVDVAPSVGLDVIGSAGGAIVDDFDNDGLLDVVESGLDPCEPMRIFHNNGDGTFTDVSAKAGLFEQLGGINMVQTDYNNDGWLDVFVVRGGWEFPMRNSLLRNNRDGTFTDVTLAAGLGDTRFRTQSAAWADYDNDGNVDVFVGHELAPSQLFRNKGDGTFEDVSRTAGVDRTAYTKGVTWGDYDGDGYPDLYVSNIGAANFLYRNRGDGTFEEVSRKLGVSRPVLSFPCWFFDYDNDGKLDLFVSSYTFAGGEWVRPYLGMERLAESMKLYRNTGQGGFADVTTAVGLDRAVATMGANYGDVDNDGYLDLYLGTGTPSYSTLTPNLMFRNNEGRSFVDITTSSGTGHLQKGHGVAFADVDNDGNQDIFENIGGAVPGDKYNRVLFKNPGHDGSWISIKLVGVKSNRAAIGAKVKLTLVGKRGAKEIRYREVTSGGSFGASPLTVHVGLGAAKTIARMEVIWPASKTTQVFTDVAADQFIEVKELEKSYTRRRMEPIDLGPDRDPETKKPHHGAASSR